jgi:hypothetical protein
MKTPSESGCATAGDKNDKDSQSYPLIRRKETANKCNLLQHGTYYYYNLQAE